MNYLDKIWEVSKETVIKNVLLRVGLSVSGPLGPVVVFLVGKFLDKFVKPLFIQGVAKGIQFKSIQENKAKMRDLDDAIKQGDTDAINDVLDSLN